MSKMAKTRGSICREQGPAFITPPRVLPWPYESLKQWVLDNVPDGYRYKSATDHTAAGWRRPHGDPNARHR